MQFTYSYAAHSRSISQCDVIFWDFPLLIRRVVKKRRPLYVPIATDGPGGWPSRPNHPFFPRVETCVYCSTPITCLLCPSNILYFCAALIVPHEVPLRPGVQTTAGLLCLMTTRLISLLPETPGAVPSTLFHRISGRPYLWKYVVYFHPGRTGRASEGRPSPTSQLSESLLST